MNLSRIKTDIETMARFTATPGKGVTRLCFTNEEWAARKYIRTRMLEAGLEVRTDAAGNIFGRRRGSDDDAPVVMIGSHFDSVRNGGQFDGVAGLAAALEVSRQIAERGMALRHPVEVCAFVDEEGGRFGAGLFGSRALVGRIAPEELNRRSSPGVSRAEAMRLMGFEPEEISQARRAPGSIKAFIELHIEQGPVLEKVGKRIGIVDSIVGIRLFRVAVEGSADHAGTTPMGMRRDALMGAARIIEDVETIARTMSPGAVATVGTMQVQPGSFNVVPALVEFSVDMRDREVSLLDKGEELLKAKIARVCSERGLEYSVVKTMDVQPVKASPEVTSLLERKCVQLGLPCMHMNSGAGHDAMIIAEVASVGMIFVPSKNGKSHCPEEWTDYEDIALGARVLFESVVELATEV